MYNHVITIIILCRAYRDLGTIKISNRIQDLVLPCTVHVDYMYYNNIIILLLLLFLPHMQLFNHMQLDYGVEFEDHQVIAFEGSFFFVLLEVTQFGSPSQDATISITRDDNGPAINDIVISMADVFYHFPQIEFVEGFIPNNEIRLGDREISLTLTTSDDLIEIGPQSTAIVYIIEDDYGRK